MDDARYLRENIAQVGRFYRKVEPEGYDLDMSATRIFCADPVPMLAASRAGSIRRQIRRGCCRPPSGAAGAPGGGAPEALREIAQAGAGGRAPEVRLRLIPRAERAAGDRD